MMSFDFFWFLRLFFLLFFFFNATATTDIYTLSLHDALPICHIKFNLTIPLQQLNGLETLVIIMVANKYAFLQITRRRFSCCRDRKSGSAGMPRPISYAVFCLKKKNRGKTQRIAGGFSSTVENI